MALNPLISPRSAPSLWHPFFPSQEIQSDTPRPTFLSSASVAAQARLPEIQGRRATFYAGAWCGYGFHEDGIRAAVDAVRAMGGVEVPWVAR